jgi:hypothetical protein
MSASTSSSSNDGDDTGMPDEVDDKLDNCKVECRISIAFRINDEDDAFMETAVSSAEIRPEGPPDETFISLFILTLSFILLLLLLFL